MALPPKFCTPHEYFATAVEFLKTHAWIYQHANTRFVGAGVLDKFPDDWTEYFLGVSNKELNDFPLVYKTVLPDLTSETLQAYREELKNLIPPEAFEEPEAPPAELASHRNKFRGVSIKKQHEITRLGRLISEKCGAEELLVDFGAGLGYLSEFLHSLNRERRILCIEACPLRVIIAEGRLPPGAEKSIRYKAEFINEHSQDFILANVAQLAPQGTPLSIIGLHACGDLTITSMKLFLSMDAARRLIIMPCCYHKFKMSTATEFVNFPLSASLKQVVAEDAELFAYFNRPFLRLACQQTTARWSSCTAEQHAKHGAEMFRRAFIEAIIDDDEVVKPVKVKLRKGPINLSNDEAGFCNLIQSYELRAKTHQLHCWDKDHFDKYQEIVGRYGATGHKLAEGLTCLQTAMQKLCENIVLYDQLCYMEECASALGLHIRVRYQKLLNEHVSPRCYVLIAEKL